MNTTLFKTLLMGLTITLLTLPSSNIFAGEYTYKFTVPEIT